jgi:hypothetical protein
MGTGEHYVKWHKPDSEKQRSHVFSYKWKIAPIQHDICISHVSNSGIVRED